MIKNYYVGLELAAMYIIIMQFSGINIILLVVFLQFTLCFSYILLFKIFLDTNIFIDVKRSSYLGYLNQLISKLTNIKYLQADHTKR